MADRWDGYGPATRAIRAGQYQDVSDQHSEALVLTSSYVFDDAEDASEKFAGRRPGNVYVRFTNPTVQAFEARVAALEEAEAAVATGSGMAAYTLLAMAMLEAGHHVLLGDGLFGTTTNLFRVHLQRLGISVDVVDVTDVDQWRDAIRPNTRMFVLETPTNPVMKVADVRALAALALGRDIVLVVDNTLCTPVFQNPLALGADLVVHSAGKYIDGQGRCGGGIIAGRSTEIGRLQSVLRSTGPSLSPFNAWVFMKGLETLPVRMREHQANAVHLADWLRRHGAIGEVHFTGDGSHPQADLIAKQQFGHGGLVSFTVGDDQSDAWRVMDSLRLISNTTNIGDTKTMITHPATTTHGRLSPEERRQAGIADNLLRVSVGLEDIGDLLSDLDSAVARGLRR